MEPIKSFADDMTAVMEETEENLKKMKEIFEAFRKLSGLEINEKKTKGANLEDTKPLIDEVKFEYVTKFTLLGVEFDNKLELMTENFVERKKKIRKKIAIWRKLNLNTVGNLIVAKTFLISQLGYLLSMLECTKEQLKEIQNDIDSFILRSKSHWISKERIHLEPDKGGLAAI